MNHSETILNELELLGNKLGVWREHIILGGGVALLVYDALMAKSFASPVGTTDMDWLIPRVPIVGSGSKHIPEILDSLGYQFRQKDFGTPPVTSYWKDVEDLEIEVEFLTESRARERSNSVLIKDAGVTAQTLSYLEMSMEHSTKATLKNGSEIRVVSPDAWVFHKGLTFTRRSKRTSKLYKDLYGIWFVLTQLGDFSDGVLINLKLLKSKTHANWAKSFHQNLNNWVKDAVPIDWKNLIQQDPAGRLTEASFRGLVLRLQI